MTPLGRYQDVATLLNVSLRTLYGYINAKALPSDCYVGHGRFNMTALERHIQNNTLFQKRQAFSLLESSGKVDYKKRIRQLQEEMTAVI